LHEVIYQPPELLATLTAAITPASMTPSLHHSTTPSPPLLAVCTCDPWNCPDLELTPAELVIHELNWPKLARALCLGLGLDFKFTEFSLQQTRQLGSWSADAVP